MATARPQCSANQESPGFSHGECQCHFFLVVPETPHAFLLGFLSFGFHFLADIEVFLAIARCQADVGGAQGGEAQDGEGEAFVSSEHFIALDQEACFAQVGYGFFRRGAFGEADRAMPTDTGTAAWENFYILRTCKGVVIDGIIF